MNTVNAHVASTKRRMPSSQVRTGAHDGVGCSKFASKGTPFSRIGHAAAQQKTKCRGLRAPASPIQIQFLSCSLSLSARGPIDRRLTRNRLQLESRGVSAFVRALLSSRRAAAQERCRRATRGFSRDVAAQ